MARVPTPVTQGAQNIGAVKPIAADTPFQSFQTSGDMFGAGLGKSLSSAGSELMGAAQDIKAFSDKRAEDASLIKTMELEGMVLENDAEQRRIFSQTNLGGAKDAAKNYKKQVDDFNNKLDTKGLTPTAAARFKLFRLKSGTTGYSAAFRHESEQTELQIVGLANERTKSYSEAAQGQYNNPQLAIDATNVIRSSETLAGQRLGLEKTQIDANVQDKVSAMNLGRIKAAITDDNSAFAKKIYEEGKLNNSIDGDDLEAAQGMLKTATMKDESRKNAEAYISGAEGEQDALDKAKKIKDTGVYDATVARIKDHYATGRRIDNDARVANKREAWKLVADGGSFDDLGPDQKASLDGTTISSMKAFEARRAKTGVGYAAISKPSVMVELHNLYQADKTKFTEEQIINKIGDLSESDFKYWLKLQSTVDKADEKSKAKAISYTMSDKLAKEYLNEAQIKYGTSAGEDDAKKSNKVLSLVREMVDDAYTKGVPITRADIDKGLANIFLTGELYTRGEFFDPDGKAFEFKGVETKGGFVIVDAGEQKPRISKASGVPQTELDGIFKAIDANDNLDMNVQTIMDLYAKKKKKG